MAKQFAQGKYTLKNPNKYVNIPLWLFPVYCSFALGAIETYKIFNLIFKTNKFLHAKYIQDPE